MSHSIVICIDSHQEGNNISIDYWNSEMPFEKNENHAKNNRANQWIIWYQNILKITFCKHDKLKSITLWCLKTMARRKVYTIRKHENVFINLHDGKMQGKLEKTTTLFIHCQHILIWLYLHGNWQHNDISSEIYTTGDS